MLAPEMPSHVHDVYRLTDSGKKRRLVAKKTWTGSPEVDILRRLAAFTEKNKHILLFEDQFESPRSTWLVFPRLNPLVEAFMFGGAPAHEGLPASARKFFPNAVMWACCALSAPNSLSQLDNFYVGYRRTE